jgi:predicted Zn finger-like uncharacterized protein
MRLVCPSCAAQYEVPDDAIPAAGRDVQCSDCGHGWFQKRPAAPPPRTLPTAPDLAQDASPEPPRPGPSDLAGGAAPSPPPRKPLDEQVMAILREEALREAAARRADASRMAGAAPRPATAAGATGGDAPPPPPGPAPTLISRAPAPAEPAAPPRPAARRERLPDIEEINSALAGAGRRGGNTPLRPEDDRRPGFRAGFGLMLVVVGIAAGAYALAPRIATLLPQSAEAMTVYVGAVDHLRRQMDAAVAMGRDQLDGLLHPVE